MPYEKTSSKYRRILLKLSGEALGQGGVGIDPKVLDQTALEVGQLISLGVQVGLVIGGGNLFRGASLSKAGLDRVTGDQMGMLATVMNALAMRDAFQRADTESIVMSAIPISSIVERYDHQLAVRNLEEGNVVIFSGGTGNPFFTTDSAACLRGIEINADLVLKATKVDGVYSDDPIVNPDAIKYAELTYDEILDKELGVMDLTAICLARAHGMPLRVFAMNEIGALRNAVFGDSEGTLITN